MSKENGGGQSLSLRLALTQQFNGDEAERYGRVKMDANNRGGGGQRTKGKCQHSRAKSIPMDQQRRREGRRRRRAWRKKPKMLQSQRTGGKANGREGKKTGKIGGGGAMDKMLGCSSTRTVGQRAEANVDRRRREKRGGGEMAGRKRGELN
ncbi:hypothetical protein niasHT_017634 [Heterodera trifolii]|uniref:Uncharacterized protein n=1 Tax=Heterodera trifolii TaxID=157864 RepID=A0ABD2L862_9BILA